MALYSLCQRNVTNVWLTIIYFFLSLNWRKGSFYLYALHDSPPSILEKMFMNYVFCLLKKIKLGFVSKKIHISYFFSVSKVINKIFRFGRYIWCTFSFFINKNAKIKTDLQLFINDKQWYCYIRILSPSMTIEKQENYTIA